MTEPATVNFKKTTMKKVFYPMLAGLLLVSSAFMSVTSQEWKIGDDHLIKFSSKDPTGTFSSFKGNINFDEADLAKAKFDLTIDVNSIAMGNGMKNKKALTEEWFDEAKYKTITYVSSAVEKSGDSYKVTGTLKMKGKSKVYPITLKFVKTSTGGKFTGTFNVSRKDFGVGKPSEVVPDIMKIDFSVPVTKK